MKNLLTKYPTLKLGQVMSRVCFGMLGGIILVGYLVFAYDGIISLLSPNRFLTPKSMTTEMILASFLTCFVAPFVLFGSFTMLFYSRFGKDFGSWLYKKDG